MGQKKNWRMDLQTVFTGGSKRWGGEREGVTGVCCKLLSRKEEE